MIIECKCCKKTPEQLSEYVEMVEMGEYATATEAVLDNEGTYNRKTGKFYCTSCYIKAGMPMGVA